MTVVHTGIINVNKLTQNKLNGRGLIIRINYLCAVCCLFVCLFVCLLTNLYNMEGKVGSELTTSRTLYSRFPPLCAFSIAKYCAMLQCFAISPGSCHLGNPASHPFFSCLPPSLLLPPALSSPASRPLFPCLPPSLLFLHTLNVIK